MQTWPSAPTSTRDNPFELRSLNPHTLSGKTIKCSFFPDDLEIWNSLPSDVALANYNSFKSFSFIYVLTRSVHTTYSIILCMLLYVSLSCIISFRKKTSYTVITYSFIFESTLSVAIRTMRHVIGYF